MNDNQVFHDVNANFSKKSKKNSKDSGVYLTLLTSLQKIIFNLTDENFDLAIEQTIKLFDKKFPYSFNVTISNLIYLSFYSHKNSYLSDLYIKYLEKIQTKEEIEQSYLKVITIFIDYICGIKSQESYYLIEKMIEQKIIETNIIKNIKTNYFIHHRSKKYPHIYSKNDPIYIFLMKNYKELSKNDWEIHKQLIQEGQNPNEIAKIIRNDEIEKLQEISSQNDFYFNQRIKPSLYERCSFINQENVTLIDYAAFFSAVKCFKYLLMNDSKIDNTGKYAIAGGNLEIIHLCEQNHISFQNAYETAIIFHQNDIFKYLYENKIEEYAQQKENDLKFLCIKYGNYELLSFLEDISSKGFNDSIFKESARTGNLYLVKHFLPRNIITVDLLCKSSESKNFELVQYILKQKRSNINAKDLNLFCFIFVLIILCFIIILGKYLNHFQQHLCMQLKMVIQEQLNYFLNKRELILMTEIIFDLLKGNLEIIFGNFFKYLKQHLYWHLKNDIQK